MQAILNFIVDILSQPAILVALIAFIGFNRSEKTCRNDHFRNH